jgi:hypothetical protein
MREKVYRKGILKILHFRDENGEWEPPKDGGSTYISAVKIFC